jgi:outer membrane protein assembly factor BamB
MRLAVFLLSVCACAQVPYERIVHADEEAGNWLTYSGNYAGHRFSPLTRITPANVSGLRVKWAYQFENRRTEVSPLVVDGVMYITAPNRAAALDARTGRELWTWSRPVPKDYQPIGFGRVSRGPAILGDRLFVATLDCYLVALDLRSGIERWSAKVEDYKPGYSMTLAPLAIRGKVLVGVSGGEAGIRGFVDAYDAATGKRAWRFYTVPGPGEPGHETWSGDAWKTGGGSTWVTGSYDPELNLVYWGVGNPGPDWNPDSRPGDNRYTCSLVALDGDTGKLKWHFQFTPHDSHDWDSTHVPMLFDASVRGVRRKLVAVANRNAFLLCIGPYQRRVHRRRVVCEADLGEGAERPGPSHGASQHRTERAGDAAVAESQRRYRVVQSGVQSADGPGVRGGARDRIGVLQARGRVQAWHVLRRRRGIRSAGERGIGRDPRAGFGYWRAPLGVSAALGAVGRRAGYRGRTRLLRHG